VKEGSLAVSKGATNPWVYRVQFIDRRVNCAFCQYVGHNGRVRPDKTWSERDRWKSLEEIILATGQQLRAAVAAPGDSESQYVKKFDRVMAILKGLPVPGSFKPHCEHDWKSYTGFSESYKFCTKCSEKVGSD
jgi:hypothetical protein